MISVPIGRSPRARIKPLQSSLLPTLRFWSQKPSFVTAFAGVADLHSNQLECTRDQAESSVDLIDLKGVTPFIQSMVALKDGLDIKTLVGTMENRLKETEEKKPQNRYVEKLKSSVGEATRNNVA